MEGTEEGMNVGGKVGLILETKVVESNDGDGLSLGEVHTIRIQSSSRNE